MEAFGGLSDATIVGVGDSCVGRTRACGSAGAAGRTAASDHSRDAADRGARQRVGGRPRSGSPFLQPGAAHRRSYGNGPVDYATWVGRHDGNARIGLRRRQVVDDPRVGSSVRGLQRQSDDAVPVLCLMSCSRAAPRQAPVCSPRLAEPSPGKDFDSARRASTPPIASRCRQTRSTRPLTQPISHGVLVADLGVARNSLGGVLAFSFQNLGGSSNGDGTGIMAPKQALAGWSMSRQAGPLDLALYTQWTIREDWQAAGAGIEVGYSWIEGLFCGAAGRRPEARIQCRTAVQLWRGIYGRSAHN